MPDWSRSASSWRTRLLLLAAAGLTACAGPASAGSAHDPPASPGAAFGAPPPHALFTRLPHLCPLISTALLDTYLPGTRVHGESVSVRTGEPMECGWDLRDGGAIFLFVNRLGSADAAREWVNGEGVRLGPMHPDWKMYRVTGVGDQAVGYTVRKACAQGFIAQLYARYVNVEFELHECRQRPLPAPAGQLTALIAFARAFVANLART